MRVVDNFMSAKYSIRKKLFRNFAECASSDRPTSGAGNEAACFCLWEKS